MRRGSLLTLRSEDCPDCTRRQVVQTLGMAGAAAAASLLGLGCNGGGDEPLPDAPDPLAGTTMCGANLCVLLGDMANASLLNVGGARVIVLPDKKLLVVRRATDDFVVLSAVCTHAGCTVAYAASINEVACPCHGSRYNLGGAVVEGPATVSLKRYNSTFDVAMQTVTIVL